MIIGNIVAYVLTIIGGLNWGLVGIFNFNLISFIAGTDRNWFTITVYVLVLLAALWLIISPILTKGKFYLCPEREIEDKSKTL